MYEPAPFRVEDEAQLVAFVRAHPLGLLVTAAGEGPTVNPLPFLVHGAGASLTLKAHMARANPQWREIEGGARALVVFQGAHHYVSPGWYASKAATGRVVPTWNYMLVEARGRARTHHDEGWLRALVDELTGVHEAGRAEPWRVSDAPADFATAQLRAIVGIEFAVERLAGKFKLSQNRPAHDRDSVMAGLDGEAGDAAAAIAQAMRAAKAKSEGGS